jgi:hypothetical protein
MCLVLAHRATRMMTAFRVLARQCPLQAYWCILFAAFNLPCIEPRQVTHYWGSTCHAHLLPLLCCMTGDLPIVVPTLMAFTVHCIFHHSPCHTTCTLFSGHRSTHSSVTGNIPPVSQRIPGLLPLHGRPLYSICLLYFIGPQSLANIPVTNQITGTSPIS